MTAGGRRSPAPPGLDRRDDLVVQRVPLPHGRVRVDARDFLGRLRAQEAPDGTRLQYAYDLAGHLRRVTHSSGAWVEFGQDDAGREWWSRTSRTETVIRVTADGLPLAVVQRADGHEWTVEYRREPTGWPVVATGPWPGDLAGHVRIETDPARRRTTLRFSNGTSTVEELMPGPRLRLARVSRAGAMGGERVVEFEYGDAARLSRVGGTSARYDEACRLVAWGESWTCAHDAQGRRTRSRRHGRTTAYAHQGWAVSEARVDGGLVTFAYDELGRRLRRRGPDGETHYAYDLFGQLAGVTLPDGRRVEYLHDGFGRLVGRAVDGRVRYYVVGVDGHRLAESDGAGRVTASYVWVGPQCVGRVVEGRLAQSYHRIHAGLLAGIGDAAGAMRDVDGDDPFGGAVEDGVPGLASLFGDPLTGLVHAGTRWLDPALGQFVTPDTWCGIDPAELVPRELRAALDRLPGGTGRSITERTAYAWCAGDPVNFTDPTGHNWLGVVWSLLSAFLWGAQTNSVALQMEMLNIAFDPIRFFVGLFGPGLDWYWKYSIFNVTGPVGSYRMMTGALLLNGFWRSIIGQDTLWVFGNVIWARPGDWDIADQRTRELVVAPGVSGFLTATAPAASDAFLVRNPRARLRGTVAARAVGATADQIDNAVWDPADATAIADGLPGSAAVAVDRGGGGLDEIRTVDVVTGTTIHLRTPLLPDPYVGQPVEVTRLDPSFAWLQHGGEALGQSIAFVRGDTIHLPRHVRDGFPSKRLIVKELLPMRAPHRARPLQFPVELDVLRMKAGETNAGFAGSEFLRLQRGDTYLACQVVRGRASRDLVITPPLDAARGPYVGLEVVTLLPTGTSALDQAAAGGPGGARSRVGLGGIRARAALADKPLRRLDGLELSAAAGKERRIVLDFRLQVSVDPLPAELRGVAVKLDVLTADTSGRAAGTMDGGDGRTVVTAPGDADRLRAAEPVRVRTTTAPRTEGVAVVASVTGGNRIALAEPLALPAFAAGVAVEVHPLTVVRTHDAETVAAAGDRVVIPAPEGDEVATGAVVRVRTVAAPERSAVRAIATAPADLAVLDAPLPASHATGLAVGHFAADASTRRREVTAPDVRRTLTMTDPAPYTAGAILHIADTLNIAGLPGQEETVAEVERVSGSDVVLTQSVEGFSLGRVEVQIVEPSGREARDGRLAGGTVLVPADPSVELTRLEALQQHELRHVWQAAIWGPFFLSLPIPWLVHLGFAFTPLSNKGSSVARHISLGGLDSLFAAAAWGLGGAEGEKKVDGQLGADRKTVTLAGTPDPALVREFARDRRVTVERGERDALNFIDALDEAARRITLRFALDADFFDIAAPGDTVTITMSPFENIRQTVSTWFGLNLEQLWSQHIPVAWGRVLSSFLNKDSWLPPFGPPLFGLIIAGKTRERAPTEQEASYLTGDLYTTIALGRPSEIYVGQFARLFAFVHARSSGISRSGDAVKTLTVELPAAAAPLTAAAIAARVDGAVLVPHTRTVRFRENRFIPMKERAENVVGVFFSTAHPGTYTVDAPGTLKEPVVFKVGFDVDFLELSRVRVKPLAVTPRPGEAFFETERIDFAIRGDESAVYELRFPPGSVNNLGAVTGARYAAGTLAAGAGTRAQVVQITARYRPDHPIFRGAGQLDRTLLRPEDLVNLCEEHTLTIRELTAPALGPVPAGTVTDFAVPIVPDDVRVTSPMPPGAIVNARVINGSGRPARLKFVGPNNVSVATPVTVELVFGADPAVRKTVVATVMVEPAPGATGTDPQFLAGVASDDYLRYIQPATLGLVRPLINGRSSGGAGPDVDLTEPLDRMETIVKSLGAGDVVYLSAWFFEPATPLTAGGHLGATTWGALFARMAGAGVKIRIIINDFDPISGMDRALQSKCLTPLDAIIGAMPLAERDNYKYIVSLHPAHVGRLRSLAAGQGGRDIFIASHHQKFMVARRGDETFAFCGGLDIETRKTPARWSYAGLVTWHDLHVMLEGPITRDLEREFVMRWNREKAGSTRAALAGWAPHETLATPPLGPTDDTPAKKPHRVQMIRTVSTDSAFDPYATQRDDVAEVYRRAIETASQYLYLENQYFRSTRLADWIVRQGRAQTNLVVIMVVVASAADDDGTNPITAHGDHLQFETFETIQAGLGARARFYTMVHRAVHSKFLMIDDRWMTIGSANANVRSFELDSELNVSIGDAPLVTAFRRRLWAHNLGVPEATVAGWSLAEFLPRWDAVAAANAPKALDLMDGEGVLRFDHTTNPGQRHGSVPDAVARLDLAPPSHVFFGIIPDGQTTVRLA
ncbi:MAG TPA: phospholipase D-like domain-containing protein [Methylomirabilota bacterium]